MHSETSWVARDEDCQQYGPDEGLQRQPGKDSQRPHRLSDQTFPRLRQPLHEIENGKEQPQVNRSQLRMFGPRILCHHVGIVHIAPRLANL